MRYPCPECDYDAPKEQALKKHVESKHKDVRYPCLQCEFTATTTGDLKKHVESKH